MKPCIAAYFAFCDDRSAAKVAVYAYVESHSGAKSYTNPRLSFQGPHTASEQRHLDQDARYTVAAHLDGNDGRHHFCRHQMVFGEGVPGQDILYKVTMPAADRDVALKELGDCGISDLVSDNAEDSRVIALATREFGPKSTTTTP